jgi:hypothetical protein
LRQVPRIQDRIERVSKPELGLPLFGVGEAQVREQIAAAAGNIAGFRLANARSCHDGPHNPAARLSAGVQ